MSKSTSCSFSSKRAHTCLYGKASTIICLNNSPTSLTRLFTKEEQKHVNRIKSCYIWKERGSSFPSKMLLLNHCETHFGVVCQRHYLGFFMRKIGDWKKGDWLVHKMQKWWKIKFKKNNNKMMVVQVFLQLKWHSLESALDQVIPYSRGEIEEMSQKEQCNLQEIARTTGTGSPLLM